MLKGSVMAMLLHDVCEEIRLEELRAMLGARRAEPSFKHATPEYVRFEKPPVVESATPICLSSGEELRTQIKYYEYGVVSVVFELPFEGEWDSLATLAARFVPSAELERTAQEIVRGRLERISSTIVRPYTQWISEDYYVFVVNESKAIPPAPTCWRMKSPKSRVSPRRVRNLRSPSAPTIYRPALVLSQRSGRGWLERRAPMTQCPPELKPPFRFWVCPCNCWSFAIDELLDRELASVYPSFKRRANLIARWRMGREASRLNSVTVEVTELVERADTAIKIVSDMFAARLYRLAANKVGVPEYKNLVNEKLKTAENLYRFLIDEFQQSRSFVLEVMVVIILVIELIFLFRGKY